MTDLDRRLNAFRGDLADARLAGRVEAARYVEPQSARVVVPVADLRRGPSADAPIDSQLLFGDEVDLFDGADGWCWVQARLDRYVGYIAATSLGPAGPLPNHRVAVPRTFIYPGPDMKLPPVAALSIGSSVAVCGEAETRGTRYALREDGSALVSSHLVPIADVAKDFVDVAETLLNAPYLWGGASAFGVDCSGLVQLSMRMAGREVSRDTDMQAGSIGTSLHSDRILRRGDLVFWKGHVGIMTDPHTLLHANGHTMLVSREPLADAVARIGYLYGQPTAFRRP
ncbi:MAG: NlpC/P60 family protein [Rhizobiaceae bacterium]